MCIRDSPGAGGRVRQSGEYLRCARSGSWPRDGDPDGDWLKPLAHAAPGAGGSGPLVAGRRSCWNLCRRGAVEGVEPVAAHREIPDPCDGRCGCCLLYTSCVATGRSIQSRGWGEIWYSVIWTGPPVYSRCKAAEITKCTRSTLKLGFPLTAPKFRLSGNGFPPQPAGPSSLRASTR